MEAPVTQKMIASNATKKCPQENKNMSKKSEARENAQY